MTCLRGKPLFARDIMRRPSVNEWFARRPWRFSWLRRLSRFWRRPWGNDQRSATPLRVARTLRGERAIRMLEHPESFDLWLCNGVPPRTVIGEDRILPRLVVSEDGMFYPCGKRLPSMEYVGRW